MLYKLQAKTPEGHKDSTLTWSLCPEALLDFKRMESIPGNQALCAAQDRMAAREAPGLHRANSQSSKATS